MSRPLKATALICALCLLLTVPAWAASWTVLDPADYVSTSHRSEDDIVTVVYRFGIDPLIRYQLTLADGTGLYQGSCNGSFQSPIGESYALPFRFSVYPLGDDFSVTGNLTSFDASSVAIDARDFKPNAAVTINSNITVQGDYYHTTNNDPAVTTYVGLTVYYKLYGYDVNGKYVDELNKPIGKTFGVSSGDASPYTLRLSEVLNLAEFNGPVRYIVPYFYFSTNTAGGNSNLCVNNFKISCQDYNITTTTDMLLKDSLTMQAIENQLEDLNDKQDQTNDKLDELLQQPEQEKQEASSGGQGAADELTGAIPNHSEGFMTAIQNLAGAMSYDGTEASFIMPSITLPEIPGVMKKYVLSEPVRVDFGFWIQKMPVKLLTLVQVLGTLSLVVFSFKEFYGLIEYAMTLKGGKSDG